MNNDDERDYDEESANSSVLEYQDSECTHCMHWSRMEDICCWCHDDPEV